jgi:hypothetical protein
MVGILFPYIITIIFVIICLYVGHLLLKYMYGKDYKPTFTLENLKNLTIIGITLFIAFIFVILYHKLSGEEITDFILYGSA